MAKSELMHARTLMEGSPNHVGVSEGSLASRKAQWDALPSRVETNFLKLLDLFSQKNVTVTCFFLGWVAETFPRLVKEARRRGHAIYGNQKNALNLVINHLFRGSMRLRFELVMQGCNPVEGQSVADIGCGPGHYSINLAKRRAGAVLGIDFAPGMIRLAKQNAERSGVADRCRFVCADFLTFPVGLTFDYSIAMGFMDYVTDPEQVIDKALSITKSKAFFSFPVDGGFLAWQRKQRYKNRCDLFLYSFEQVKRLFKTKAYRKFDSRRISRDFLVTVHFESSQEQL